MAMILQSPLVHAGALLWVLASCGGTQPPGEMGGGMPVTVAPVETGTVVDSSEFAGRLNSRQSVVLRPQVSAQVTEVLVRQGDRVPAGTPLVRFDARTQEAAVVDGEAAVAATEAEVAARRAAQAQAESSLRALLSRRASLVSELTLQQQDASRDRQLADAGAIPRRTLDTRLRDLSSAQAELRALDQEIQAQQFRVTQSEAELVSTQRRLSQNEVRVVQQEVQLGFFVVSAPFAGVVGDIPVKAGDYATPNTEVLTFSSVEDPQLELELAIPVEQVPKLKPGLTVQVLDAQGAVQATGTVFFIAPNADVRSQSVLAKARIPARGKEGAFRADQLVRSRVIWSERTGLLVPVSAISRLAGQNFLFLAEKTASCTPTDTTKAEPALRACQRPVKLGRIVGNQQEVVSGVDRNAQIVTTGIQLLQNDTPIVPLPPESTP
ncbi:MAG: efflux RND transporter periplasmic adaptor subunit [Oscillatoriales cyanobacterium SM2_2_1]|nr:efflux RND transporter periplasmic adaptor subunit [Oscillatoriales cyanobacterium SM2_2_1]